MAMVAKTKGYLAIGFGEPSQGTMKGSDIAVMNYVGGKPGVDDMYALDFTKPLKDKKQDYVGDSAAQNDTHTAVEIRRPLQTNDFQDWPITHGVTKMTFAFGSSSKLTYHMANRWIRPVHLFGKPGPNPWEPKETDLQTVTIQVHNYSVPSDHVTTYACSGGVLPDVDAHMVKFEITPGSPYVHHMIMYGCTDDGKNAAQKYAEKPGVCNDMRGCTQPIFLWAPGRPNTVMPPEAGFRMGSKVKYGVKYVLIQLHLNNAKHLNFVDNTAVKIWYTKTRRPNDAGVMMIGDIGQELPPMPPKQPYIPFQLGCPGECTQDWGHEITVFNNLLHMHHAGSRIWSTVHRKNGSMEEIFRIDFWDYGAPRSGDLRVHKFQPGDQLNLNCVFQTMNRDKVTTFGAGTNNEMCLSFLVYYPIVLTKQQQEWNVCGYAPFRRGDNQLQTYCGSSYGEPEAMKWGVVNNPPAIQDPIGCQTLAFGTSGPMKTPVCSHPIDASTLPKQGRQALRTVAGPCEVFDCGKYGKCEPTDHAVYPQMCKCLKGFSGVHCDKMDATLCAPNPCKNGGTCTAKYGAPVCTCSKGFFGSLCEQQKAPSTSCDSLKLSKCILGATFLEKCQQYEEYAKCAQESHCMDVLDIWCSSIMYHDWPCGSWQWCEAKGPWSKCNTDVYRQCVVPLKKQKFNNQCESATAYLACAQAGQCADMMGFMCERNANLKDCPALKSACHSQVQLVTSSETTAEEVNDRLANPDVEQWAALEKTLGMTEQHDRPTISSNRSHILPIMGFVAGGIFVVVAAIGLVAKRLLSRDTSMDYTEAGEEESL
eukprot:TRINITY_DN94633_c0_g1_i1.p1 TRINITY_DN94633_c0_g1~~TRINITY_DN94633_c0_g1_i1.p1  ORF type:complete len:871 (+),score=80.58 TRINITY_DN94633_c0_g1_i1:167-2614(+)